jgi:NADH-quinone oxidoreductase subunit L
MHHSAEATHAVAHHHSLFTEYLLMSISVVIALVGIFFAYIMYIKKRDLPQMLAEKFKILYRLIFNKWYVDELYDFVIIRPFHLVSNFFWKGVDVVVIDGLVNGVAKVVGWGSGVLRYIQSGYVQSYAVSVVLGTVALLIYYFLRVLP